MTTRTWQDPPPALPSWLRALTGRGKRLKPGATVPELSMALAPRRADPEHLAKYRQLCGFTESAWLPLPYPQVLAGPLHVAMLTDPSFPLSALGIVHLRNRIEQAAPIGVDDLFDLTASIQGHREVANGVEIDVVTVATVHGQEVWRSVITALSKTRARPEGKPMEKKEKPPVEEMGPPDRSLLLRVPEDIGRRYAKVASDWNPIHQYATTAKLFGFPRAIAHGMWSLGRCLAEVQDDVPQGAVVCDVAFRKPVLLPSTVALQAWRTAEGVRFALEGVSGGKVHLVGSVVRA